MHQSFFFLFFLLFKHIFHCVFLQPRFNMPVSSLSQATYIHFFPLLFFIDLANTSFHHVVYIPVKEVCTSTVSIFIVAFMNLHFDPFSRWELSSWPYKPPPTPPTLIILSLNCDYSSNSYPVVFRIFKVKVLIFSNDINFIVDPLGVCFSVPQYYSTNYKL